MVSISRQPTISGYFFLTFDGFILTLCSSNVISDNSFVTFGSSLTFFITFDGFILTLCSSNITYDSSFVTFGDSLTFSSYLTVLFSYCAVPTSHVTVLLSHSVVLLLFFSHLTVLFYIMQFQHHM